MLNCSARTSPRGVAPRKLLTPHRRSRCLLELCANGWFRRRATLGLWSGLPLRPTCVRGGGLHLPGAAFHPRRSAAVSANSAPAEPIPSPATRHRAVPRVDARNGPATRHGFVWATSLPVTILPRDIRDLFGEPAGGARSALNWPQPETTHGVAPQLKLTPPQRIRVDVPAPDCTRSVLREPRFSRHRLLTPHGVAYCVRLHVICDTEFN
jgi:hypothetical protein